MTENKFYTELYINAIPETVWDKFISPTGFFKSFYGTEIQSTFNVGESIKFVSQQAGQKTIHIYGNIVAIEKHKLLVYTEHPGAIYTDKHSVLNSIIKITFDRVGHSTKLTLLNDQFSHPSLEEKANQWFLVLSNFKTYIETGKLMTLK